MNHSSHNKGFTLIELLVVIAIIGLLSAILLASVKSVKDQANIAKATQTIHGLQLALALYFDDHQDWPSKAGDGRMVISNGPSGGWTQFYTMISPYMRGVTPDASYQVASGLLSQGFEYLKGTESNPVQTGMYNSKTNTYIGCIKIYQGYWMDDILPSGQTKVTLNDGGVDPDALDHIEGHYTIDASIPAASCPTSAAIF